MTNDRVVESEIEKFVAFFLHQQFGDSPPLVNAVMRSPFIVTHLIGFLLPGENILLKRGETKRVSQTRDFLLNGVKPELFRELANITGYDVKESYSDWNFAQKSGLLIVMLDRDVDTSSLLFPEDMDKEALHEKIISISKKNQKAPEAIESYWMNDSTVLIERQGIMMDIEKELIKNGVIEELRLAKRPLEHRIMEFFKLEPVLKQEISELFVDWNFEEDKSYMVFILNPKQD